MRKNLFKKLFSVILTLLSCFLLVTFAFAEETAEIPTAEFANTSSDTPDLSITKTVKSAVPGSAVPDADFSFTLKIDGKSYSSKVYELFDLEGNRVEGLPGENEAAGADGLFMTDENGGFSLKDGQTVKFSRIGTGASYEVYETISDDSFVQTYPAGNGHVTGHIPSEGASITFENTYYPKSSSGDLGGSDETYTELRVSKNVLLPSGYELPDTPDFGFTLLISGSPYTDKTFNIVDSSGESVGGGRTDEKGHFTLKGGQTAVFSDILAGLDYEVTEDASPERWRQTDSTGISGVTAALMTFASFTNTEADFAVRAKIQKSSGTSQEETPPETDFKFYLTGEDDLALSGVSFYLYDANKALVSQEVSQTGADGSFTLKADQTALFIGLDPGTKYQIKEERTPGYKQVFPLNNEGYLGTAGSSAVTEYDFISEEQKVGDLSVTNTVTGNGADKTGEWQFTVTLDDPAINGLYGADSETGMNFTEGKASFTLIDGQARKASGLPEGIQYTVTETVKEGYLVTKTGDTGTIQESQESIASFMNTRPISHLTEDKTENTPGAGENVRVGDTIVYKISCENASQNEANILITDKLEEGLDFVSATDGGTFDTASRTVTWKLTVPADTSERQVSLTAKVSGKAVKRVENTANVRFDDLPGIDTETIVNPLVGDLIVSETVTGNAAEEGKAFSFQVKLNDNGITGLYGADDETGMNFKDGEAAFTLMDGQAKSAVGLPAGTLYTVTETSEEGYIVSRTGETGMITGDVPAKAAFTNTKSVSHMTEASPGEGKAVSDGEEIVYRISYENATPNPLRIIITDTLEKGLDFVSATDGGVYNEDTRTVNWTFDAVEPESLERSVSLTVRVNDQAAGKIENTASSFYGELPAVLTKTIENPIGGDLSVTKKVSGSGADKQKNWHFTVTLSDPSVNGVYGDDDLAGMVFADGIAQFTLKDGETKTVKGLPPEVTYTVTELEENQDGYQTGKENDTGVILAGAEANVTFTNHKDASVILPDTGGSGLGFLLIFSLILCLSGAFYLWTKKLEKEIDE